MKSKNKVVVTIATYNEEKNIGALLENMPDNVDVIVVDDGSSDSTIKICKQYGARVVKHHQNLGQGAAVITGFRAALLDDYDVIIEMDGDGQHNPKDIPLFLDKLNNSDADIVVGSRIRGSNYQGAPIFRRMFLPFLTWIINILTGYKLTDSMLGFRAFRAKSLRNAQHILFQFDEPQYLASEMFIRFSRSGFRVEEIPIVLENRSSGSSYKGLLRYGFGVFRTIIRTYFFS